MAEFQEDMLFKNVSEEDASILIGFLVKNPKTRTRCENDICAGRYPRICYFRSVCAFLRFFPIFRLQNRRSEGVSKMGRAQVRNSPRILPRFAPRLL